MRTFHGTFSFEYGESPTPCTTQHSVRVLLRAVHDALRMYAEKYSCSSGNVSSRCPGWKWLLLVDCYELLLLM